MPKTKKPFCQKRLQGGPACVLLGRGGPGQGSLPCSAAAAGKGSELQVARMPRSTMAYFFSPLASQQTDQGLEAAWG